MDTRFLESLIAVVEAGSIAGAARLQRLTPAAVSQRIQSLERDIGCELLSRSAHTARPNENCLNLIPRARKLVHEAYALQYDIDTTGLSGTIRIGAISTALTGLLPSALHHLAEGAPKVKPHITPGTSQLLYDQLQAQSLDAAILVAPPFEFSKNIDSALLREEPLLLISGNKKIRSLKETLSREPYICYDSESWGGRIAAQYLVDNKIVPDTLCELDSLEAIHILVEKGMGVSLVPHWSGFKPKPGRLFMKEIKGSHYIRKLVLLTQKHCKVPEIINQLKRALFG